MRFGEGEHEFEGGESEPIPAIMFMDGMVQAFQLSGNGLQGFDSQAEHFNAQQLLKCQREMGWTLTIFVVAVHADQGSGGSGG